MISDVQSSSPVDNATDFAPQHNDAGISSVAAQTRATDDDTNEHLKAQTACLLEETKIVRAQQNTSTTGYLEQNYKQLDLERIKANHKLFNSYTRLQDYATFHVSTISVYHCLMSHGFVFPPLLFSHATYLAITISH